MKNRSWVGVVAATVVLAWMGPTQAARGAARHDDGTFVLVESRIFDAVAYDAGARRLTLLFDNGVAYIYRDVPRDVYLDFTRIVNKGEYFSRRIRSVYAGERLDHGRAWCVNR